MLLPVILDESAQLFAQFFSSVSSPFATHTNMNISYDAANRNYN